jgi:hypothetical protein
MRAIFKGRPKCETRATFRHIQNFAAYGLRVLTNDYFGGATHHESLAFSVYRRPYNHCFVRLPRTINEDEWLKKSKKTILCNQALERARQRTPPLPALKRRDNR